MHCHFSMGAEGSAIPAIRCLSALGQWAVQLLQCTASLPGSSGRWNSCHALPQQPGAVGSGPSAISASTSWGDGESRPRGGRCLTKELLQRTASLPGGGGQCNSCNALPRCLGAVGSGTRVIHRHIAWGQWAAQLLQYTAALLRRSGQWNSYNTLPHCTGARSSATSAMHCPTIWGRWAVDLLQCAGPPAGGRVVLAGRRSLTNKGTPAMHCHTAWGQWAVQLLQYTASLPGGSGQCNSRNALPHCLGALGSGSSVMHRRTAQG